MHLKKCFFLTTALLIFTFVKSAEQTCTASLGDPIINISFGSGSNFGPPLPSGTTSSLQYEANTCPADGNYSIVNYTSGCWPNDVVWHTATDHTGNSGGYYMLVNASNQPSDFYIQTVDGLCGGTTYQFAAWLLDMCSVKGILPNITFTIEGVDGSVLNTYNTGDIPIINPVTWQQYGFFFTTPPGVSKVLLRMRNNAPGGVGNDLGLDDITFRPAGPAITTSITGHATDTISLCAGDTASLHFTSSVENCFGNTAYQWQLSLDKGTSWSPISGANGAKYARNATPPGTYLYRLTVSQAANIGISNCSVASDPIRVTIDPLPVVTITGNSPKCSGDVVVLLASGGTVYRWQGPNGFSATGAQVSLQNITIANAGKYRVSVADSNSCLVSDSVTVQVYPRPVAAFFITGPACENNTVSFTDQSATAGQPLLKWAWDFGDGAIASAASPSHIFNDTGNYPVSLYVENDKGCKSDTIKKYLAVHSWPRPGFKMPGICLTDPFAAFTDFSSIADNSESQFLYAWDFGDTNASVSNPNQSDQKDPRHAYAATGVYSVKLSITSKDGCVKDTVQNFTVNGSQPVAKFTIDPAVNFCSNGDFIIVNEAAVNFGNITRIEIYWDYQNDPSVKTIDSFPLSGKKYTHRYPDFGNPITKEAVIRYVVYSGMSCVNAILQRITLNAAPAIRFDSLNAVCEDVDPFVLTQAQEINGISGLGLYRGAGITGDSLFNPLIATAGTHVIRYSFLTDSGCSAFAEKSIQVFAPPVAEAGPDQSILSGDYAVLAANTNGNNIRYEWAPDTNIDNNQIPAPRVSPLVNTVYTLKVTSANGCMASDQVLVNVLNDIYVPTAFSPNGDGLNDTWHIPFMASYTGASVKVFNRFGQLVYHSAGGSTGWDGKFKGKLQPLASYTWVLDPGNGRKLLYGMVTIIH